VTFSWALLPIVDAVAALVSLPGGFTLDGAGALPQEYRPNTLYAAPGLQTAAVADTGGTDQVDFRIRLAYSVSSAGEDGGLLRLRSVSDAEEAGLLLIAAAVVAHRQGSLWDWLKVEQAQPDAVAQIDCRVLFVDLSGYRLVPGS
jgi:hypothetical protein